MSQVEMEVAPCGFLEIVDSRSSRTRDGDGAYTSESAPEPSESSTNTRRH